MNRADIIIVGGGIVGLAVGYRIRRDFPEKRIVILEKESEIAKHQTGHNSGVLHSGIYYKPGSLKAKNCREGKLAMEQFCREHGIEYEICGKVIVAVSDREVPRLKEIHSRGRANEVECEMIDREQLNALEPYTAGIQAIHVPETGIVNFQQVCSRLGEIILEGPGEMEMNTRVLDLREEEDKVVVKSTRGIYEAALVVNCAGLYSDKVTAMTQKCEAKIVPFRGEYYRLKPEAYYLCRNLIYPVPDPAFPFLGVHFTRLIGGSVECGPNAVLALAREGYRKTDFNLRELMDTLTYPAFWKVSVRYWRTGLGEIWRSISKRAFVKALQRLVPEIHESHLEAAPAGIRAQALAPDGNLVDDFLIQESRRVVNVCNAPSPAATASLNIAKLIVERLSIH